MSSSDIVVGGVRAKSRSRSTGLLRVSERMCGAAVEIPVIVLQGESERPVTWLTSGVHGDEYEGPMAAARIAAAIDPNLLHGTLVVTPVLNLSAFEGKLRVSLLDLLDLNRAFPGNPGGSPTARLASTVFTEMKNLADYVLDLHSGGNDKLILPYASYYDKGDAGKKAGELARAAGLDLIMRTDGARPTGGGLASSLVAEGVPAITVESGAEGRLRDEYIEVHCRVVMNVLKHLKMLAGEPSMAEKQACVTNATDLYVSRGGLIRYFVRPKDFVRQGDALGEIVDLFGTKVEVLRAPKDGVITLVKTHPATFTGDRVITMAEYAPA